MIPGYVRFLSSPVKVFACAPCRQLGFLRPCRPPFFNIVSFPFSGIFCGGEVLVPRIRTIFIWAFPLPDREGFRGFHQKPVGVFSASFFSDFASKKPFSTELFWWQTQTSAVRFLGLVPEAMVAPRFFHFLFSTRRPPQTLHPEVLHESCLYNPGGTLSSPRALVPPLTFFPPHTVHQHSALCPPATLFWLFALLVFVEVQSWTTCTLTITLAGLVFFLVLPFF